MRRDALSRWALTLLMVTMGVLHFVAPRPFVRIVPAWLPSPLVLVYVSGVAEAAGGIGLQIPRLRRAAAWGLVALYIAVFPANVNMAVNAIQPENATLPVWTFWARLPLQIALVYWAWTHTRRAPAAA
jgi:uncharacterized membrane protein